MTMKITLQDVQRGYDDWAAQPHNKKWVRKIDGTPIANDIVVRIFTALSDSPSDAERHERAIPDGWQLVPKAMDVGMIGAWYRYKNGWHSHDEPAPRDTSDAGAWAALLAASPSPPVAVQEPVAVKAKVIKRRTMVELLSAVYEHHGWRRIEGESRANRVQKLYEITADAPNNVFVATPALSTSQSEPAPEMASRRVKLTKEGAKDAALDFVRKIGWKPGNSISLHSSVELMAAFGLMIDAGEVQCDWPNCGCCTDAACRDAVTFMDFEAEIVALRAENELLREALPEELTGKLQWAMHDAFMNSKADTVAGQMIDVYDAVRAAVAPEQEEAK